MQEAAEVVVLVEDVEERLDFHRVELKGREGHRLAELTRDGAVTVQNFAKGQHGCTKQVMDRIPQGLKPVDCANLTSELKLRPPKPQHCGLKPVAATRSTRECSASG